MSIWLNIDPLRKPGLPLAATAIFQPKSRRFSFLTPVVTADVTAVIVAASANKISEEAMGVVILEI